MRYLFFLFCALTAGWIFAQNEYLEHPVDIINYDVDIVLNDAHDTIKVDERIQFNLTKECDSFFVDLVSVTEGKGMFLTGSIALDGKKIASKHRNNRIWIYPDSDWLGETKELSLSFKGVPKTGLIIGENKFGDRTYFGDNWPNRAHHWFACIDHPSDKATLEFDIVVPEKYHCIATGKFISSARLGEGQQIRYTYKTDIPLPTKVMVIGVAEFAVKMYKTKLDYEVTAWVYPEDAQDGFKDMKASVEVLEYFTEILRAYPYEKLANVQSTTQFGGMENAGNIFYDENAVKGDNSMEALIAHEIAHQWFGNSASEMDWPHLWLSEGFATYLTDLFWEHKYGRAAMNKRLISERNRVLNFAKHYDHPVVDEDYKDLMDLLNPNSYQKGAWVLHMLREKIGLDKFLIGIKDYHEKYKLSNATTDDFRIVMEEASGEDLSQFFEQWLHRPLHPILNINTTAQKKQKTLEINQVQKGAAFQFELEVEIIYADKTTETVNVSVVNKETRFELPSNKEVSGFRFDPNVKLLFEQVEF